MCFSPQASFGAAAVLSVLGIAGLKKTGGSKKALIAAVPSIFAVQQTLEGFVWLAIGRGDYSSLGYTIPVYFYLFFASTFWPLYLPIVLWYLEQNLTRKQWLIAPLAAGIVVALVALINLCVGGPVNVSVVNHHIAYAQTVPFFFSTTLYYIGLVFYLVATSGALFISTIPYAPIMGVLIILALTAAQIWYYFAFGSVWCFFAAVCSALILLAI
jgi:hypothetical protein